MLRFVLQQVYWGIYQLSTCHYTGTDGCRKSEQLNVLTLSGQYTGFILLDPVLK